MDLKTLNHKLENIIMNDPEMADKPIIMSQSGEQIERVVVQPDFIYLDDKKEW